MSRLSPGARIVASLVAGLATGLFLGERAAPFQVLADGFVRLLQMAVLPYVTVSLIAGIGSLEPSTAKRLFTRVGLVTLLLWSLALGMVFLMPLCFPALESASFFSTTLVSTSPDVDFVALYIPSNPFHALANNVVPAVVVFSTLVGIALMGVPGRLGLIETLRTAESALGRVNRMVSALTPLGLFAIAAHTAGTLDFEQAVRLRVYLAAYATLTLLVSLWVFPGLVACLTPLRVTEVLRGTRDVLLTAFMIGDLFVVLPTLVERAQALIAADAGPDGADPTAPEVIVSAFYNFPHSAKLLSLSFVLFAAWYSETALRPLAYPGLALAGVFSLFGSINVAIPYLLDFARVPADTYQLFLATGPINSRFGTLAGASHMLVLAIVGAYALRGRVHPTPARVLRYAATTAALTAGTLLGLNLLLASLGAGAYRGDQLALGLGALLPRHDRVAVLADLPATPLRAPGDTRTLLPRVRERGALRVGFVAGQAPFSHFNARGELVGLDVELAHELARELGVRLELAPVSRETVLDAVETERVDLVMSGVVVTAGRASRVAFSPPYMDETLAFIVPDHRRAEFSDADWVRARDGLRIGVPALPNMEELVRREFPRARLQAVDLDASATLASGLGALDALVLTAERGSFLTLIEPALAVAVPHPLQVRLPLAWPVAGHDADAVRFLGTWIELKRKDGTLQRLHDHWILGRNARAREPRWSVLRNVLGYGGTR